jgi:branched-chain amino acid transport system permease protein
VIVAAFTWTEFAQQIAAGLRQGAVFAGLALALVIIYRSTRAINFAQGEMATFATFICWSLMNNGLSFWAAFPIVLAISFLGGVAIERTIIRPVENGPVITVVIITLGLALLLNGLMNIIWGGGSRAFHGPFSTRTIDVGGVPISVQDIGIVAVSFVLVALLAVFFRFTKLGLGLRAAALNRGSSELVGVRVGWMLAFGWGLADPVSGPEHDAGDPALRVRGGDPRRSRQPDRRSRRRAAARGDHHAARPLRRFRR